MRNFRSYRHGLAIGFSLALMAGVTAGARAASTVIADWKFEPGANFLTDSSGNGNNLKVAHATLQSGNGGADVTYDDSATSVAGPYTIAANNSMDRSGSAGYASFDGAASLITQNTLNLSGYNQLTIEWFADRVTPKAGGYNGNFIFYDGNPSDFNGTTGTVSFQVAANVSTQTTFYDFGGTNLNDNSATVDQWHEYAITVDRPTGTITMYQDYTQVGQVVYGAAFPAFLDSDFVIGKDFFYANNGSDRHFDGYIDELSISAGILTPSEFLSVPEPASLSLIAVGGMMLLRRRRV